MSKVRVLIEVEAALDSAFARHNDAASSEVESLNQAEALMRNLAGYGIELVEHFPPVPIFAEQVVAKESGGFAAFNSLEESPDAPSSSLIIAAEVEREKIAEIASQPGVRVWPNSELTLFCSCRDEIRPDESRHLFDLANSAAGLDCQPFKPAVSIESIRELLGVEPIWRNGFRGQNVAVGIVDEGVNGRIYPVVGGFSAIMGFRPGNADIRSHGSMCAAGVLVAAPAAKIYDYPFSRSPDSGGALQIFQAVLNQRRLNGTPQLLSNSYGFTSRPPRSSSPFHEVWDINHVLHIKIREVVASGASVFFAAGNCGGQCPYSACTRESIGPGNSIHGSNSLREVITVAAVNSRHERIGYSSQGPGVFERAKPDIAAYSHFHGNFGPGRPAGGTASNFDTGTSAAASVAAGVGALLMSAHPQLDPGRLKRALLSTAYDLGAPGWDTETGYGVINAAAAFASLSRG